MRPIRCFAALALLTAAPLIRAGLQVPTEVPAEQLVAVCNFSSNFDLTVRPQGLLFDRASPSPQRIELGDASLRVDGVVVPLRTEQEDRINLFQRHLRALIPRIKQLAAQAVDLTAQSVREQTALLDLSAQTQADLDARLRARGIELKQRISASQSSHDWHGAAFDQYTQQLAADLGPLLAGDLGQQAVQAALSGDLQQAAALRDKASQLASQMQPRVLGQMQALRPKAQALCPAVRQLYDDQAGLRDGSGRPLDLLQSSP